jgi:hypothetical protein
MFGGLFPEIIKVGQDVLFHVFAIVVAHIEDSKLRFDVVHLRLLPIGVFLPFRLFEFSVDPIDMMTEDVFFRICEIVTYDLDPLYGVFVIRK